MNSTLGNSPEDLLHAMEATCMLPFSDTVTDKDGTSSNTGIDQMLLGYWHELTEEYHLDVSSNVDKDQLYELALPTLQGNWVNTRYF